MIRAAALAAAIVVSATAAGAVTAGERLADPALEARARAIGKELRCLVCQNQSIDDSNAVVAQDLRRLVRERLLAGDDDDAVIAYIHARYGDFVLLNPPLKPETYLLWGAPALALALGVFAAVGAFRRRGADADAAPLSAQEEERVQAMLAGAEEPKRP